MEKSYEINKKEGLPKKTIEKKKKIQKIKSIKRLSRFSIENSFQMKNSPAKNKIFFINKNILKKDHHQIEKQKTNLIKFKESSNLQAKKILKNNSKIQNLENYKKKEMVELLNDYPYFFSLKNLFKEFFKYKNLSSLVVQSLNFFELRRLMDFLDFELDYYSPISKKKKIILSNLNFKTQNYLLKNFQGKNLNCIRKFFRQIFNRMVEKFFLKQNYIKFFFNNPNKEMMVIIENFLREFKKKDSFIIFSFENFRKYFDLTLDEYYSEQLEKFYIKLEYFGKFENIDKDIENFKNYVIEMSNLSNCVRYLKEIYEPPL